MFALALVSIQWGYSRARDLACGFAVHGYCATYTSHALTHPRTHTPAQPRTLLSDLGALRKDHAKVASRLKDREGAVQRLQKSLDELSMFV